MGVGMGTGIGGVRVDRDVGEGMTGGEGDSKLKTLVSYFLTFISTRITYSYVRSVFSTRSWAGAHYVSLSRYCYWSCRRGGES